MARNKVQFQKGLSEAQFAVLYGTEDQCREAVMRWRWPSGFVCPVCAGQHHSFVKTRALYQCTACRRQTSVIAGTIFAATKVPLCTWFRAMYHLTQSKGGISSIELGRRLGVTQTTAWKIKHKLMQVMMERDATKRLTGRIEIDDAYLGGERNGGKRGRGSPGKTPIVASVETTPEGKPIRLKLRRVKGFRRAEIATLARRNFHLASTVVSDRLRTSRDLDRSRQDRGWVVGWQDQRPGENSLRAVPAAERHLLACAIARIVLKEQRHPFVQSGCTVLDLLHRVGRHDNFDATGRLERPFGV